jgi:hypothetical protein
VELSANKVTGRAGAGVAVHVHCKAGEKHQELDRGRASEQKCGQLKTGFSLFYFVQIHIVTLMVYYLNLCVNNEGPVF